MVHWCLSWGQPVCLGHTGCGSILKNLNPVFNPYDEFLTCLDILSCYLSFSLAQSFPDASPIPSICACHGIVARGFPETTCRGSSVLQACLLWRLTSGCSLELDNAGLGDVRAVCWTGSHIGRYFRKSLRYFETPHNFFINHPAVKWIMKHFPKWKLNWRSVKAVQPSYILKVLNQCTTWCILCSPAAAGILLLLPQIITVIINLCSTTVGGKTLRTVTLLNVGEANVNVT